MPSVRKPPPAGHGRADLVPTGLYSLDWVRGALGLGYDALRREVRAGRLRAARRCGKTWLKGAWVLDWIEAAEVKGSG